MKIDWFDSEKYFFTDLTVKRQITDSISENLTDSDLESKFVGNFTIIKKSLLLIWRQSVRFIL